MQLIVLKFNSDNLALLDILALVFNQSSRFHQFNAHRMAEFEPSLEQVHNKIIRAIVYAARNGPASIQIKTNCS